MYNACLGHLQWTAAMTSGNYRQASAKPPFKPRRVRILLTVRITLLSGHSHYMLLRAKNLQLANVWLSWKMQNIINLIGRNTSAEQKGGICHKPPSQYLTSVRATIPGRWKGWRGLLEIWQTYRVVYTCSHVSRLHCNLLIQLTLS